MEKEENKYSILSSKTGEDVEDLHMWTRNEKQKWLLTLFIGTSALYASRTSMPLLIPAISKERNWSKTDSGTILSSFFWGYTLTQVLGGYLSDRIGGQKVILTAAVGWSLCTFWMPYFIWFLSDQRSSVNFIVLIRVLHGAFQGLLGFMWTFVLRYYTLALDRRKAAIVSVPLKLHSSLPTREKLPVPWVKLFKRLSFWSCVIGHACQNNCFFLLLSWLPTYFHDTFPQAKGWVVNMLPWLFCIPCTFLGKWLSERCIARGYSTTATRKIIEVICLGTQALSLILINQISSYYWALLNMTLAIAATGFHNNAILVNPQDLAPKHSGSVFGLMNTVGAVPGFLGVYLAGYILETTKSWSAVFHTTAAINMIGCIIYVVFGSGNAIV
ncbi:voltage-gated purine nucleotide uniporter SLC17A9 isoform X3 [Anabrus simplex]|uniref:voltage-gated purine nucleotide uniporter SLC17A9 isoform X3 n=1 Tax=Anabrus simplex TaxID=316456 RepID=UPI0034DD66C7